jgi:hypothetical protein
VYDRLLKHVGRVYLAIHIPPLLGGEREGRGRGESERVYLAIHIPPLQIVHHSGSTVRVQWEYSRSTE